MRRFFLPLIWLLALQLAFADAPSVRIAVISDYTDKDLAALVTSELSATPDVAVLERDEFSKIGDELKLQQMAGSDPTTLGKLLGADGLLFLNKASDGRQIRFTAVDLGFALFEVHPPDSVKLPELAKSIAHGVIGYAPKLKLDPGKVIPISILNLHSEYATPESTELEQKLTILLENRLMDLPDFIVLERRHAWSLGFEHSLTENPKQLLRGEYILEGSLSQPVQNPPSADVQARLQLRSSNQKQKSIVIDGSTNNLPSFVDQLAFQIQKSIGGTNAVALPDSGQSQKEAREYLKEGIWAMQHGAYESALPALDSAALLGETSPDLIAARIRMLHWRAGQGLGSSSSDLKPLPPGPPSLDQRVDDATEALRETIRYRDGDMENKLQLLDIHMDMDNRTWELMTQMSMLISQLLTALDEVKSPRADDLRHSLRSITDYDPIHGKPGTVFSANPWYQREIFVDEWASSLEEELAYYHLICTMPHDFLPFGSFPGKFCHRFINNPDEEKRVFDRFVQDLKKDPACKFAALIILSNSSDESVADPAYKELLKQLWIQRDDLVQDKWFNTQYLPYSIRKKYGAEAIPLLHYYLTHGTIATCHWPRYFDILWQPDSWSESDAKSIWAEYLIAKNRYVNLADWYGQYEAPVLKKFPELTFPVPTEKALKGDSIIVKLLWTPWGPPERPKSYFPIYASDAIGNSLYLLSTAGFYKINLPDKKIEAISTPETILGGSCGGGMQASQNTLYLDYLTSDPPTPFNTHRLAIYDLKSKTWSRQTPPFAFQGSSLVRNSVFATMPMNEGLFRYEWDSGKSTLLYSIRRKPALNQFDDQLSGQVGGVALGPGGRLCTLVGGVFYLRDKPGDWLEVFHSNAYSILSNHFEDKTLMWSQEGEVVLLDPAQPEPEFLVGGKKRKLLKVLPIDKKGICTIDPIQPKTPWDAPERPDNPYAQPLKGVGMHKGQLFVMEMATGDPDCYHLLVYSKKFGRIPHKITLRFKMNGALPYDPASENGKDIYGLPSVNFLTCNQGFCFVCDSGVWFLPFKDIDTFLKAHPSSE